MKPPTDKQAQACENATGKVCHCRCGGAAHGRNAGGTKDDGSIDRAFFEGLPVDDPHHLTSAAEKKHAKELARLQRRRAEWVEKGWSPAGWDIRIAELTKP